jgi:CheY-specific phosphatase CheX
MTNFYRDIFTGVMFVTGMTGFLLGEFIISSALFAAATITSIVNINFKVEKKQGA